MDTTPHQATPGAASGAEPAAPPSGPVRIREVVDGDLRFSIAGTDYRLEAAAGESVPASVAAGQRLDGALHVVARKVWAVPAGGRFVEPVFGRPRRLQGLVLGADGAAGTIHVDAGGLKVVARLGHQGQEAADFPPQSLVTFSVEDRTVFETAAPSAAPAPA